MYMPQSVRQALPENALDLKSIGFKPPYSCLYITVGLEEADQGYNEVATDIAGLGRCDQLHQGIWKLNSTSSTTEVFRLLNKSLLDRRIDGGTSLFVLDTYEMEAKWYLGRRLADHLSALWRRNNDVFIAATPASPEGSVSLEEMILEMGAVVSLGRHIWYLSSALTLKDVFGRLIKHASAQSSLLVFDALGHQAAWQQAA